MLDLVADVRAVDARPTRPSGSCPTSPRSSRRVARPATGARAVRRLARDTRPGSSPRCARGPRWALRHAGLAERRAAVDDAA